jgi:hypothetical protein
MRKRNTNNFSKNIQKKSGKFCQAFFDRSFSKLYDNIPAEPDDAQRFNLNEIKSWWRLVQQEFWCVVKGSISFNIIKHLINIYYGNIFGGLK